MILSIFDANWFIDNQAKLIWTGLIIIADIILYIILKFVASRIKNKASNRAKGLTQVIKNLIAITFVFLSIVIVLDFWEFDTGTVLVLSGALVLVLGIGAHDIIRDVFNGISNTFANIYDIDDIIEIDGFKGKVIKISLTKTTLQGMNGELKTISSSKIKEVINYSRTYSSVTMEICVSYKENIDKVIELLEENLPSLKDEYSQILEGPIINGIEDMDANNIYIRISAKTTPENHLPVQRAIKKRIIDIFKEEKISFGNKGCNKNE